ncbi:MAG TPA: 6-bladed beta-propeller [Saprospiraceae bacterium]|nr:6-bladed beta-propeller [Saprospiraceae bacterium]HMP23318.1 6-bladed beta-propeller [Saprospiraceae bacterium]
MIKIIKPYYNYILLLIGLLAAACQPETNPTDTSVVAIDPTQALFSKASTVFSDIEYIPLLDTTIGRTQRKILHVNNHYFVQTARPACILRYDAKGKLVSQICQGGQGAGKYRGITDFVVDTKDSTVLILTGSLFKIFRYDFQGNFIADYKITPVSPWRFEILDEEHFVLYCSQISDRNTTRTVFFNHTTGELHEGYLPIKSNEARYMNFLTYNNFCRLPDGTLCAFYPLNDTIYAISRDECRPHRIIDFGKYAITHDFLAQPHKDVRDFFINLRKPGNDFAGRMIRYYETDTYFTFIFEHRGQLPLLLYDKQTRRYQLSARLFDDISLPGFPLYNNDPDEKAPKGVTDDNRLIFSLDAEYIRAHIDSVKQVSAPEAWAKLQQEYPQWRHLNETINISSNPVLIVAKVKPL